MTNEMILQNELDSFMDCFYGYLLSESNNELLPASIRVPFADLTENYGADLAFYLDGREKEYFADYTYFRSERYAGEIYVSIPFGEIEIDSDTWRALPESDQGDWVESGGYYYQSLPAVTIVYTLPVLAEIYADMCDHYGPENPDPFGVVCYDNAGESFDRFTAVHTVPNGSGAGIWFDYVGMSENPFSPLGFGQHGEINADNVPDITKKDTHLGRRIPFSDMPKDCQNLVRQDLKNLF